MIRKEKGIETRALLVGCGAAVLLRRGRLGFLTSMRLGLGMIKKEYLPMTVPNRQDVISSYVGRPAMRCREQSDKGFTLLEMLVVVAVIGVLVAIAIPVFTQQKEKAANETDAYNAKQIARQLEYYYTTNPDKVAHLLAIEPESPGAMEVIVLTDGTVIPAHSTLVSRRPAAATSSPSSAAGE